MNNKHEPWRLINVNANGWRNPMDRHLDRLAPAYVGNFRRTFATRDEAKRLLTLHALAGDPVMDRT